VKSPGTIRITNHVGSLLRCSYHFHDHYPFKFVEVRRQRGYNVPMKRKPVLRLLLIYCAASLLAAGPKNIKDCLRLLPEKYLGLAGTTLPAAERLAMIEIDDSANGWLRLSGRGRNAFEGWIELALFRRGPGGPMLGVAVNHCGPRCEQRLLFLSWVGGEWEEITGRVFSPLSENRVRALYHREFPGDESADDPPVLYRLPRRGTDILLVSQEAICGREAVLARLGLANGRFTEAQ